MARELFSSAAMGIVRTSDIRFGRFLLCPRRRELRRDGVPIDIGGRAFDVLALLIEARGELVAKDEIIRRLWPGAIMGDNTVQAHVSALRKALDGDRDIIRTIAGRGYRVVADFAGDRDGAAETSPPRPTAPGGNLPAGTDDLIGREGELADVTGLVAANRLVTLTGAGGIGKTRLALEAARQVPLAFPDGVWLVDLAPLTQAVLVAPTAAAKLGLGLATSAASPDGVARALGARRLLVVLDNCEHVIDAAARLSEAVMCACPDARILATSREPLRAAGERVYRVAPLETPDATAVCPDDILATAAVKLFGVRAAAAEPQFRLGPTSAVAVASICRRLDGIPLAIELAAARAAHLGLDAITARLDDCFTLLTGGHRTALPRQQTLRATLDWSFHLLSPTEQEILRRLAIFNGSFTLDAAGAIAAAGDIAPADIVDSIGNLVAKSLVVADIDGTETRYRLLETTRAYAHEKLAAGGENDATALRHAEHHDHRVASAAADEILSGPLAKARARLRR